MQKTELMNKNLLILFLLFHVVASCQPPAVPTPKGETYDPPGSTDTRTRPIEYQEKKTYQIQDIYVSNEFLGARLNNVIEGGRDTLVAFIAPENAPINKSAWFAFKVWSDTPKRVTIKLVYQDGEHRYIPKLSQDGQNWRTISRSRMQRDKQDKKSLWLDIDASYKPTWVTGQELMTSKEIFDWMDDWEARKSYVSNKKIGESRLGAPMRLMTIKETKEKNILLLIGRQHPPEVTGQIAMHEFIETILSDTDLSNRFRAKFQVYAVPLMNPDGVDQGHWRHCVGGIDLNRDWWKFRQPEVKSVTKYLTKELDKKKVKVWYGFDFHSTGSDVLYPIKEEIITKNNSITYPWIERMNQRLSSEKWAVEPFDISSPICKNWIYKTFGAEAVTYEIGDEMERSKVELKTRIAAEEMMRILLEKLSQSETKTK